MKKLRLFLVFHGRFPSERAASLFAAKSAEAFGDMADVTLLVPRRLGRSKTDAYSYFHVRRNFKISFIPTVDLFQVPFLSKIAFHISHLAFSFFCLIYLKFLASKQDIIYSNENFPLYLISFFFPNCFYEMHDFPGEGSYSFYKKFFKRAKWILIHNKWKADKALQVLDADPKKILIEPNAVELDAFNSDISKENARKRLGLDQKKFTVVYTGHLYGWKGANILAEAANLLDSNFRVHFVGGTAKDVSEFKKKYKTANIVFEGQKPHAEIPLWQKASDVLVIPNTAKENISKYYTSPMKLFEYMASSRPVVASRIPSIEEIVSENEAFFFEADNPKSLANVLKEVSLNPQIALKKAQSAFEKVGHHTWHKRARRIVKFAEVEL